MPRAGYLTSLWVYSKTKSLDSQERGRFSVNQVGIPCMGPFHLSHFCLPTDPPRLTGSSGWEALRRPEGGVSIPRGHGTPLGSTQIPAGLGEWGVRFEALVR